MAIQLKELQHNPNDPDVKWVEDSHQAYIVQELRRIGYCFQAGLEGIRLSAGLRNKAKALGMEAGFPDLTVYLPSSKTILIELKRWKGVVSTNQKERHSELAGLGHIVYIVKEKTPHLAFERVLSILEDCDD